LKHRTFVFFLLVNTIVAFHEPWIFHFLLVFKLFPICNRSSLGVVHCKLNKLSKPTCLAYLSSLESIFIHCNIFWLSFTLDIGFFLTSLLTCYSTCILLFRFIIVLVLNLGCWGIMFEIGPSLKSYGRNTSSLLIGFYSFFSSPGFDVRVGCGCS
jgi:hypothetical protein